MSCSLLRIAGLILRCERRQENISGLWIYPSDPRVLPLPLKGSRGHCGRLVKIDGRQGEIKGEVNLMGLFSSAESESVDLDAKRQAEFEKPYSKKRATTTSYGVDKAIELMRDLL